MLINQAKPTLYLLQIYDYRKENVDQLAEKGGTIMAKTQTSVHGNKPKKLLVKRFTEAQDRYNKLIAEQVDRNRQSIKLQAFINEINATDTLNLEFNDRLFNLTIINIKVYKDSHLEFNFKDGSTINIEL